jgi:hypothetical protein
MLKSGYDKGLETADNDRGFKRRFRCGRGGCDS